MPALELGLSVDKMLGRPVLADLLQLPAFKTALFEIENARSRAGEQRKEHIQRRTE
jgi:hypothetical protein